MRSLASHGLRVTGLDLSARKPGAGVAACGPEKSSFLRFVRQDMRRPFGDKAFDYVFSLFTSFGYFENPADHLKVVRNMAASLRAGGGLVLDYLNVRHAEQRLTREEVIERDGVVYRLTRWSDVGAIYKRIVIDDPRLPTPLEYVERVAKLTLEDFRFLFALNGLRVEEIYGDYQLSPFDARIVTAADLAREESRRERFFRMRLTVSGVMPRYDASMFCGTRCAIDG